MSNYDHKALDHQLNQGILGGDILGAFEKYYAEGGAFGGGQSEGLRPRVCSAPVGVFRERS